MNLPTIASLIPLLFLTEVSNASILTYDLVTNFNDGLSENIVFTFDNVTGGVNSASGTLSINNIALGGSFTSVTNSFLSGNQPIYLAPTPTINGHLYAEFDSSLPPISVPSYNFFIVNTSGFLSLDGTSYGISPYSSLYNPITQIFDFTSSQSNPYTTWTLTQIPTSVPVPTAMFLFASGILGFGVFRKKRI